MTAPAATTRPADAEPLLRVADASAQYGQVVAIRDVSIDIGAGQVVGLIGPNGAGKTTVLRAISGLVPCSAGTITFQGRGRIERMRPDEIVRLGIVQVPEGRMVFSDFTVDDNLSVGAYGRSDRSGVDADRKAAYETFPVLFDRRTQLAGSLSGGEQQMLALARGLMARPTLLLLDEPSLGLAPLVIQEVYRRLREFNEQRGISMLLVEQNATLAFGICQHVYVLAAGKVVLSGPTEELQQDDVWKSYLGVRAEA